VIELRFDETLYDGLAVDEAAKVFEPFLVAERERAEGAFVLRVTLTELAAEEGHAEPDVAAALASYALGKTVEKRGTPA
jgi:hypothetical protein